MKLSEAPTSAILAEIRKFQRARKRYPATSEIHANIGKLLAPLFAEMARRPSRIMSANGIYEVVANHKTDTLSHRAGLFDTKRKAVNWANWLAKQHYVSMVQVYYGGAGGEIVYEKLVRT